MEPGRDHSLQHVRFAPPARPRNGRRSGGGDDVRCVAQGTFHTRPVFLPDGRRFLYLALSDNPDSRRFTRARSIRRWCDGCSRAIQGPASPAPTFCISAAVRLWRALRRQSRQRDRGGHDHCRRDRVRQSAAPGGRFAVTDSVLAYRSASPDSHLDWFDRAGARVGTFPTVADYQHPSLSPDDRTLAIEKTDPSTKRHTVWLLDISRGLTSRLVSDPRGAHNPVWSPDGRQIVVLLEPSRGARRVPDSRRRLRRGLAAAGPNAASAVVVTDWSTDGRLLLCERHRGGQSDLWTLPVDAPSQGVPLLTTSADERQARLSPDMRWVAYSSNESGRHEVYVRRFPGGDSKWQVSTQGGVQPEWRRDGRELFYLAPDGTLMAATITRADTAFETGSPQRALRHGHQGLVRRPPEPVCRHARRSALSRERQRRGREFRAHHRRAELAGTAEAAVRPLLWVART